MPRFLGLDDPGLRGLAFIAQLEALASCGKSRALRQRHVAGVTTGTTCIDAHESAWLCSPVLLGCGRLQTRWRCFDAKTR